MVRPGPVPKAIRIAAPSGASAELAVVALPDATPRAAEAVATDGRPTLVLADWLSPRAQELLRTRGIGYLDSTGNVEINLSDPGLYISRRGATRNPAPQPSKSPNVRGPKAWTLLRTLAETRPPFGIRDLAAAIGVDPGYVSRVLGVLEQELLVTRTPRGPVTAVEWEGVLRRCASTYSLFDSNTTSTWVASSGPERFLGDIAGKRAGIWAVTGSFAAARIAPVAAPEVAVVYAEDVDRLSRAGRLLPTTRGANVIVAEPYAPIVFDRTVKERGVPYVSVAQVALDCLTGSARMPAEGEAVLAWMRKHEPRWRVAKLGGRLNERGS